MSKYTTEIRWIIEQTMKDSPNPVPRNALYSRAVYEKLGLASFPIFDEAYRYELTDKIINHYYVREIGFETVALFAWYMKQTMWEIMPYYNQLYQSTLLEIEPLYDFMREHEETWNEARDTSSTSSNTGTSGTQANASNNDRNVFQDTPMSLLDGTAIQDLEYATNVTYDDGISQSTTNVNTTNDSETKQEANRDGNRNFTDKGINSSQADLLLKYRKTLINVDLMIIDDLKDLFMPLW